MDKGLQVLLINMKETSSSVASFMEEHGYTSKVLLDADGAVAIEYDVFGIPVSFLIDKQGKVAQKLTGAIDWGSKDIRSLLNDLIDEQD